jgi:hypothetical protein
MGYRKNTFSRIINAKFIYSTRNPLICTNNPKELIISGEMLDN